MVDIQGYQTPTFAFYPKRATNFSEGEDVASLAADFGLFLDPWQKEVLRIWHARDDNGDLCSSRCAVSVPRQNGKNGALEADELYDMVVLGKKVLHTAHEVKTARKAFNRLVGFFEDKENGELAGMVESVRKTNGQEAIFLNNGGSVEFIARSSGSGRGFTCDTLVLDEAQDLSEDALAALMPTLAAAPSGERRTIYMGTPPSRSNNGEVFENFHDACHGKTARFSCWVEWSADFIGEDVFEIDDEEIWAKTNPALGIRLSIEQTHSECESLASATFKRERLGMWSVDDTSEVVINPGDWSACESQSIREDGGKITLSVDISPNRKSAAVAAAGNTIDGKVWVDIVDHRYTGSILWVVSKIKKIVEERDVGAVIIDERSPAGSLIESLEKAGVTVTRISTKEVAQGTGHIYDIIVDHSLVHAGNSSLSAAALSAGKRKIGDAWGWARPDSGACITPLVAMTHAVYGLGSKRSKIPMYKKRANKRRGMFVL